MLAFLDIPFSFEEPRWLWLALLCAVVVPLSWRSLAGLDPARRVASLFMRCAVILLIAACLSKINAVQRNRDLTVMFLLDRSFSCESLESRQDEYVRSVVADRPEQDRAGVLSFAANAQIEQQPMSGYFVEPGRLSRMDRTDRSDLSQGVRLALALFPSEDMKRIVLLSDGNQNLGDVVTEARRARANGIPIDVVPLQYSRPNDVSIDRMIAPSFAAKGEQVPVRMVLSTKERVGGRIDLYQNGQKIELPEESARVTLTPGSNTLYVKLPIRESGPQQFEARFRPDDERMDAVSLNNSSSTFTFVSGPSRVLFLSSNLTDDAQLIHALKDEQIDIDAFEVGETGVDLVRLQSYSAVVLANVPAGVFSDDQIEQLATYVKDLGGGLIMTGGNEGFGAGGWIGTPVEEVMPVDFEIKHKRVIPRGALVLICHSCEVPRGNYWGKEMAKRSVDTISSRDYIGVLAYSFSPSGVNWEVPFQTNANKGAVKARIDRMQIGDMPDFDETMTMAYDELVKGKGQDASQRHVIIISDGDPTPPNRTLIGQYKDAGITVSTIGIGWGAHVMTQTMNDIATSTGGRFYSPRDPNQLPQIFTKESKVIRRSLIVEEGFQPQVYHSMSDLLAGVDSDEVFPPLTGLVLTSPKNSPNVLMPLVKMTEDGQDPVLAHWQYELGKAVVFTSGYWPHWGERWTPWSKFGKLWAQIVRWAMRQDAPADFDTYTRIEGESGRVVIDALDKDANYLNFLRFKGSVVAPDGKARPVEFVQTGPGHYEAEFKADAMGQYLVTAMVTDAEKALGVLNTGATAPYSPEYRDLQTNLGLLRKIAEESGGRLLAMDAKADDVFNHHLPPVTSKRPIWEWVLAWILLPFFLMDVAVRRLASWLAISLVVETYVMVLGLFGVGVIYATMANWLNPAAWMPLILWIAVADLIGWSLRARYLKDAYDFFLGGGAALATAGERSASSLQQLRGTRARVQEGLKAPEAPEASSESLKRIPKGDKEAERKPSVAKQKYESSPGPLSPGKKDPGGQKDLSEALGGASATSPPAGAASAPKPEVKPTEGEEESMTSRLLSAKRKVRKNRGEQDKP